VRLRLDSLEEVQRGVLSMGTHATVIRPGKLRERLFRAAVLAGKWFGSAGDGDELIR
jgi:hypothetical protein